MSKKWSTYKNFLTGSTILMLIMLLLSLALPVTPALAAPAAASAIDGDGAMTVSPTSAAYGSTGNSFVFTFTPTPGYDIPSGSSARLTIPASWPAPVKLVNVFLSTGTCALNPSWTITGATVIVDINSCLDGQYFTITYSGITAPGFSGSPYTFLTETDIAGGGGIFPIASSPQVAITPGQLTVSAAGLTPADKVYDSTTAATLTIGSPTLVGVIGTDSVSLVTTGATGNFTDANVGTGKTVNISGLTLTGAQAGNYILTQPTRTANITAKPITVTVTTGQTKVYGAADPTFAYTHDALFGSDSFSGALGRAAGANVGAYAYNLGTLSAGSNYALAISATDQFTITAKPLTVTAGADTKVYNGTTSSSGVPTYTPGLIGSDTPNFTQTFDDPNAGTGKSLTPAGVVTDGNGGANYTYTFNSAATGQITPKPITVTVTAGQTKVYGAADPVFAYTNNPLIGGDSITGAVARALGANIGSYAYNLGTLNAGSNYTLSIATPDQFTITAKPLTVTAVTDTKVYDATATSAGVPTFSPALIGTDTPNFTQSFDTASAGTGKTLTPAGLVNDGNGGANYAYTFTPNTTGQITPKPITVTVTTGQTKVYGAADPVFAYTNDALLGGDTITGLLGRATGANVGSYSYNLGTLTAGGNYGLSIAATDQFTITALPLTVTAVTSTKAYDGTTSSSGVPTFAPALISGDTPNFTQTFDTANVGTAKTLTPAGTVNDGNGGLNYTYTFTADTTGSITALPITVTADAKSKTFGAADPALTYTVAPALASGDAFTGALVRAAGENPGIYAISQGTLDAGTNYAITYVGANLTVNPKISGNAGVIGVKLTYNDGGVKSVLSGAGGAYSLVVSYGWTGSVTPSKVGYTFTPIKLSYINVTANLSGKNYVAATERAKNGGFNTYLGASKIPQFWTAASFAAVDGKDTVTKKEGTASVKITGAVGKTKTLTQTLALSGAAGNKFTFSFWVKGTAVPALGTCQAQVSLYNGATLKLTKIVNCTPGTYIFQKKTLSFLATSAYTKVVIKFIYAKSAGTVWFDGVSLIR